MSAGLVKDILTDDTGVDFDPIRVVLVMSALALILLSGYDIFKAWQAYDQLLAVWTKLASSNPPIANLPPLPITPKFDTQSFGIATGAMIGSYGAKKWLSKSGPTSDKIEDDK